MLSWTRCSCLLLVGFVTFTKSSTKVYYIINNEAPKQLQTLPNMLKYLTQESKENPMYKYLNRLKKAKIKHLSNLDYDYDTYYKDDKSNSCINIGRLCVKVKELQKLRTIAERKRLARCRGPGNRHCQDRRNEEKLCDPSKGPHCRPEPVFPHWNVTTEPPTTTRSTTRRPPAFVPGWDPLESYDWKGGSVEPFRKDGDDEGIENQSTEDGRKFSTDYLDFDGLMRAEKRPNLNLNMSFDYLDKNGKRVHKTLTKEGIMNLLKKAKQLKDKRMRAKKAVDMGEIANYYLEKLAADSYPSSESSETISNSIEVKPRHVKNGLRDKRPKRFQVINRKKRPRNKKKYEESYSKSEESVQKETQESDSKDSREFQTFQDRTVEIKVENSAPFSDEVEPMKKQKVYKNVKKHTKPDKLHYIQVGGRIYKDGEDFRRELLKYRKRMQHFLPKRYHWDSSEFHKLGYFWFNGPQGQQAGPWKINFKK